MSHTDKMRMSAAVQQRSNVNIRKCMKCGKCSATCPAYDEMDYHPHEFVYMVERGRTDELMKSNAIWYCLSCLACVERCPRDVEPAALIEAVRLEELRQEHANTLRPKCVPPLVAENPDMPQQALVSAFRKFRK